MAKKKIKKLIDSYKLDFEEHKQKYIAFFILNLALFYFSFKFITIYDTMSGDFLDKSFKTILELNKVINTKIVFNFKNLINTIIMVLIVNIFVYLRNKNRKKLKKSGKEYGGARWGNMKDIAPFIDAEFKENIILTQTESLTIKNIKSLKFARNKNVMVIGGTGFGKTRFFVKPNLMQLHSSYAVTDPKGTVFDETAYLFKKAKYKLKIFNTIDFSKSMHYNPFVYIRNMSDMFIFIDSLMENTDGEGEKKGESFWIKAERMLLLACSSYVFYELEKSEHTFESIFKILQLGNVGDSMNNALDLLFKELEEKDSEHFAVLQYNSYLSGAKETKQSIIISCLARLSVFTIPEVREITSYDEMDLLSLGDEKTALFMITSDTQSTYNFLTAIMYSQMFDRLFEKAYNQGGSLKYHIRFLFDEFANSGKVPNFQRIITVLRSRNMSVNIFLQAKAQLEAMFKGQSESIIENCDSFLFLGGQFGKTTKEISEMIGNETIEVMNNSSNKGRDETFGTSYQKTGRRLLDANELSEIPRDKCILKITGLPPFFSKKYDITKHPNYKYLLDYNKKNRIDLEEFLKEERGEIDLSEEDIIEVFEFEEQEEKEN